jgi:hypothetical protein
MWELGIALDIRGYVVGALQLLDKLKVSVFLNTQEIYVSAPKNTFAYRNNSISDHL